MESTMRNVTTTAVIVEIISKLREENNVIERQLKDAKKHHENVEAQLSGEKKEWADERVSFEA